MTSQTRRDIILFAPTLTVASLAAPLKAAAVAKTLTSSVRSTAVAKPYRFNTSLPPLLSEEPDVLSQELVRPMGSSVWREDVTVGNVRDGLRIRSTYEATRVQRWVPTGLIRRAVKVDVTETRTSGFDETQRKTMQQSMGLELGANFKGLSAKVKSDLNLTEESVQHWQSSKSETRAVTYLPGMTYVSWQLVDSLTITRTWSDQQHDGERVLNEKPYPKATTTVECVYKTYEDSATDAQLAMVKAAKAA